VGPANVKVSGQPVQGRSGGGLFTADGLLVGVCNFADPTDKAGAYAALSVIQQHLDSAQLAHVYADPPPQPAGATVRPAADAKTASIATNISSKERNQPPAETGGGTLPAAGTVEVICIVRSKQRPQTDSEVIVLDDVSPEFLRRLADERRTQSRRHQTSLEVQQRRWERRVAGNGASGDPSSGWRPNWRKPRLELTER